MPKKKLIPSAEIKKETAYPARLSGMVVPPAMHEWAKAMTAQYGQSCQVWHTIYTDWLLVYMIAIYGENETLWPEVLGPRDVMRVAVWYKHHRVPRGVKYLSGESVGPEFAQALSLVVLAVIALAGVLVDPTWLLLSVPVIGAALTNFGEDRIIAGLYRSENLTIPAHQTTTAYSAGDVVRPTTWNDRLYLCVVSGTSGGSEPIWETDLGAETTDGTVTWQTCAVGVLKRPKFFALYTAMPGEAGGGTEVTGGSYARAALHPADANWAAPTAGDGGTSNVSDLTFPAPTGNWGTVVGMAELDRLSGGNMFSYGALTAPVEILNGQQAPKFPAGDLSHTWD